PLVMSRRRRRSSSARSFSPSPWHSKQYVLRMGRTCCSNVSEASAVSAARTGNAKRNTRKLRENSRFIGGPRAGGWRACGGNKVIIAAAIGEARENRGGGTKATQGKHGAFWRAVARNRFGSFGFGGSP